MLRVTLELVPRGDERSKTTLGTIEIENLTGEGLAADYAVRARGKTHADATLRNQPRDRTWGIVQAALRALFG